MIDKIISFLLLIILFPLIIFIIIIVFLEDGNPVIFKQSRIGINNKIFTIYKIRTFKKTSPNIAKERINENEYILKTGRILRPFHIDELPQLINIIKGDLLFIGYRPSLPSQKKLIEYRKNYNVNKFKPGITGWAQINYTKDQSEKEKAELDYYYYKNKKKLKIKIVIRTILKILNIKIQHRNEYIK